MIEIYKEKNMTAQMLQEIFFTCLLPLFGILCTYGILFIRKATAEVQEDVNNELFTKYTEILLGIVETCVIATNQTYVDELKKQGRFGPEEHDIAYHKTFDAVKAILTEEMQNVLKEVYGDLDFYISQLIQEQVNVIKFERSVE
jgi:hypothetical protein